MRQYQLLYYLLFSVYFVSQAEAQQRLTGIEPTSSDVVLGPPLVEDCDQGECSASALPSTALRSQRAISGGGEYLLIRPHFSEAVAFAEGSQTATSFDISARPIDFDYEGGLRSFLSVPLGIKSSFRIAYTNINGDVAIDGSVAPGEFIVDPFGNVVGSVVVIDPADARVGTQIVGGDLIQTDASVDVQVFDLDLTTEWTDCCGWWLRADAGVRIAVVDQAYDSLVTLGGGTVAAGTFAADFRGAGPRVGFDAKRQLGSRERFSLLASAHGALLLGDFDVSSGTTLGGGAFVAGQDETQRRTIPVFEIELGGNWGLTDAVDLSAGWLFHSWNDLGVSGGTFGGFFTGADDANNMSFDGLFVRADIRF